MAKKSIWETNFAENPKIRNRVYQAFSPLTRQLMDEREPLEQKWLEFFRMWNVEKDGNNPYNGRARLYIPEVRKNVEAQARQLTEAAFPNDDFLSCYPLHGTFKGADLQLQIRKFQIRQSQLRMKYHIAMRQACLFGNAPAFIPWKKTEKKIWMNKRVGAKIKPYRDTVELYNGPDFVPVDLFRWYALDPLNHDFQEAGCFYNSLVDKFEMRRRDKAGELFDLKELLSKAANALDKSELEKFIEKFEASGVILEKKGYAGEFSTAKTKNENNKILCTRIYTEMELPEAALDDEDKDMPIPVVIDLYNSEHIGLIKRNPFFHQQAPYVCGKYILPGPEEFYGQGLVWAIQYMQHEINSKAEQAMDSATLALNPLTFIDPALCGNMLDFPVEPGAIWFVNPQGVRQSAIPDTTQTGYNAISMLRGQMADYSDRSPALPPQLLGKSRTATQSEIVAASLSVDVKSFQMQNESMILNPTMEMWESLTDQNIEDKQILLLTGHEYKKAKQIIVNKNQIVGRYQYRWDASSITQNRAVLARQLIDLIKIYGTIPPQYLATVRFRLDEVFKALVREGMNLPNVERFFGLAKDEATDPETELEMLMAGLEIFVSIGEDDVQHMQKHDEQLNDPKLSADQKEALIAHIAVHESQRQEKLRAAQAAQAQMLQMQQMQAMQQQGSRGAGNRTQLSPNSSGGDIASGGRV